jgi:Ubiquitin fusion degradation protein UFD1
VELQNLLPWRVGHTAHVSSINDSQGTLVMPKWMMDNLGIQSRQLVQVRRVSLPRGTFLRLLPHNASFLQHTNPKALLEWVLPHYVALTPGDIIQISFDDKEHILQVLEVSPGRAVCLTDSDIEVDFAAPLHPSPTPTTTTTTPSTTPSSTPTKGGLALGTLVGNGVEGLDFQTCTNCFASVPKDRFTTHSLSCPRINWYCDKCKKVVQRSQKDEHLTTVHAPTPCPLGCNTTLEAYQIDEHVAKGI